MEKAIFQKNAHKIDFREISRRIFELDGKELGIINTVAKNGPMKLTEISDVTKNLETWHCTRWAVKRRINGTKKILGLKRHEFLIEKEHVKRLRGKKGGTYHLSTKGMFAALSTGLRLDEVYIYKNFIDFIKNKIIKEEENLKNKDYNSKSILNVYKEYIKNRIQLFLIWHESEGRNVSRIKSFQKYLEEFYLQIDNDFYLKFNGNEKQSKQVIKVIQNGIILGKIIQAFDAIANPNIGFGQDDDTSKFFLHNITTTGKYVWNWPHHTEIIQFMEKNKKGTINYDEHPQKKLDIGQYVTIDGENIPYYDAVKNELEEIGISKEYSENIMSYIWDKPHKQLESLKAIKF